MPPELEWIREWKESKNGSEDFRAREFTFFYFFLCGISLAFSSLCAIRLARSANKVCLNISARRKSSELRTMYKRCCTSSQREVKSMDVIFPSRRETWVNFVWQSVIICSANETTPEPKAERWQRLDTNGSKPVPFGLCCFFLSPLKYSDRIVIGCAVCVVAFSNIFRLILCKFKRCHENRTSWEKPKFFGDLLVDIF